MQKTECSTAAADDAPMHDTTSDRMRRAQRVIVDLTPILPGGSNGGLKLLAKTLVQQCARLAPDWEFLLLTSRRSHDELAELDAANVGRLCIVETESVSVSAIRGPRPSFSFRNAVKRIIHRLPDEAYFSLRTLRQRLGRRRRQLLDRPDVRGDLLFSPFLEPIADWPTLLPVVCLAVDLQYRYFGQFFSTEDRRAREWSLLQAARRADRILCISEFTRQTIVDTGRLTANKVETIPIGMAHRLPPVSESVANACLAKLGVRDARFLLYPANFWPHKNHATLLDAFAQYVAKRRESRLLLVLTGADTGGVDELNRTLERLQLHERVRLTGYVGDVELAGLMRSCAALIYPSLFEGFGMPIVEAMALDKPVLCSNVTSLPEVAGDAAILFDPRNPADIAQALERFELLTADELEQLIARGRARALLFGDSAAMARRYLQVFQRVLDERAARRRAA